MSNSAARRPPAQRYYEIQPTNFFSLPDDKQELILTRFAQLVNVAAADAPVTLTVARGHVEFEGKRHDNIRTYISCREDLAGYLSALGFGSMDVSSAPGLEVISERVRGALARYAFDGQDISFMGRHCRLFVLTALRPRMPAAWAHSLLQHCDLVTTRVKKIDPDVAVPMAQKYRTTIEAAAARRASLVPKLERADAVYQALRAQRTALFYTGVSCAILADGSRELEARSRAFLKAMKAADVRFSDVPFLQRQIALGAWRKDLIIELGSLAVMYPFVSADLLEVEEGIMLGRNV